MDGVVGERYWMYGELDLQIDGWCTGGITLGGWRGRSVDRWMVL